MPDIQVDNQLLKSVLEHLLGREDNAEQAFAVVLCAAVALARDVGGLDEQGFMEDCRSAWEGTPSGLLAPGPDPMGRRFDA